MMKIRNPYLKYLDINVHGWAQKHYVTKAALNGFECVEDLSEFDEGFR